MTAPFIDGMILHQSLAVLERGMAHKILFFSPADMVALIAPCHLQ